MNIKIQYKKVKAGVEYLGKHYLGEVVCADMESKIYWFVFDQIDVKPFGRIVEFRLINGKLESVKDHPEYALFLLCIKATIEKYRKELCN